MSVKEGRVAVKCKTNGVNMGPILNNMKPLMFYTPTVKPCKYGGLGCNTETGRCSFIFLSVSILEVFQAVQE